MSFANDYIVMRPIFGHPKLLLVCNAQKQEFVVKICKLDEFNAEYDAHLILDKKYCPYIVKLKLGGYQICSTHGILLLPKYNTFSWEIFRAHTRLFMWQLLMVSGHYLKFLELLFQAIKCCHENEIVHRDIKPSNILWYWYDNKPHILLSDFGLAIEPDTSEFEIPVGTLSFMAPDVLITRVPEEAGGAIDIWSAGVIFAELVRNN